jgi:hypothetical protein
VLVELQLSWSQLRLWEVRRDVVRRRAGVTLTKDDDLVFVWWKINFFLCKHFDFISHNINPSCIRGIQFQHRALVGRAKHLMGKTQNTGGLTNPYRGLNDKRVSEIPGGPARMMFGRFPT